MSNLIHLQKFNNLTNPPWQTFIRGTGTLQQTAQSLRFINTNTVSNSYSNAQLDDYQHLARRQFLWSPPVKLTVRARFSHPDGQLSGTAGFGFWNDPFMMTGLRWPALPKAVWFFYASPPSNMKLDIKTPGYGWKAATIDAVCWPFFALLPLAPVAIPLMNNSWLYNTFWPIGQQAIYVSEATITASMTAWHEYTLNWQKERVQFIIDDKQILDCHTAPHGPLGFVMWFDNQYMVVTPQGKLKHGLLTALGEQWLEVDLLKIS